MPAKSEELLDVWHHVPMYAQPENGCVLSSLRTAIGYYEPDAVPGYQELAVETNQQEGEGILSHEFALSLLKRGFEVVAYTDFDESRVKAERIGYLREYYRIGTSDPLWAPDDFDNYFTPEYTTEYLNLIDENAARFAQFPKYKEVVERPTLKTIKALIPNYLVQVTMIVEDDPHSALIIGCQDYQEGGGQLLFNSQNVEPTKPLLYISDYESFTEEWLPEEGIYAVRKP